MYNIRCGVSRKLELCETLASCFRAIIVYICAVVRLNKFDLIDPVILPESANKIYSS